MTKTINGINFKAMGIVTISKVVGEQVLTPIIGNGTVKSGLPKILGAVLLAGTKNTYAKYAGTGLAVDGIEDILMGSGILSKLGAVAGAKTTAGTGNTNNIDIM
ncbi:hypothetical protein [Methanococcus voltae]|uniref:Uncharacterized protein n=1 Tax=Methanococcus voltae (strain ATCC BAA-1334 / A3) TaxID=456320 RepID=D7DRB3_METV3|nr:hypothetical protein [Methanococcus voltae]MCS3901050.1 hypothetical protein [Methanococcus voltae]